MEEKPVPPKINTKIKEYFERNDVFLWNLAFLDID